MERITMSLDSALAEQFDEFRKARGYKNRSEAMRDLIREQLEKEHLAKTDEGFCVAVMSYVYNHHELELASRITKIHHKHHELNLSSLHVHLDHDHCLEIALMRGPIKDVSHFSNALMAERGVRHGKVTMVPINMDETSHTHGGATHVHSHPMT